MCCHTIVTKIHCVQLLNAKCFQFDIAVILKVKVIEKASNN